MNFEERIAQIAVHLQAEMSAEFPGWAISRDGSGRWRAVLPGSCVVIGASAAELRERLRRRAEHGSGDR
jgi:hypothetical protein